MDGAPSNPKLALRHARRTARKSKRAFSPCKGTPAGAHSIRHHTDTSDIPLAIWPTTQVTSQYQRRGRYLAESNRHPGKMLPAIARRAVTTYSSPGDLVVDPMCGIGTSLVEAVRAGRHAVGVELEGRWKALAEGNLALAWEQGASGRGTVVQGDARQLSRLLVTGARDFLSPASEPKLARLPYGAVDLVLLSPPYACDLIEVYKTTRPAGHVRDARNYSGDRRNLGHARGTAYLDAMAEVYGAAAAVLKPGGYLVTVTKSTRAGGALRDLAGQTVALCEGAGLSYWQHVIGLLATIRDGELVPRPSFWQRLAIRRALARGDRTQLVGHEDVLVFRKPQS